MKIARLYSKPGIPVRDQITWKLLTAEILDGKTGKTIFRQENVEVPEQWSQNATNILAQKYFRKAGLETGGETSAAQVFHRLAGCWTYWGEREGLLVSKADSGAFYDELFMMLAKQVAAPNSPQWFNTGLHWAYGIDGPDSGQWIATETKTRGQKSVLVEQIRTSYVNCQPHACFIQPVKDDLVNSGGIMDLAVREARLFKHGSGTGTNFSSIRGKGEKLSGGGVSSGLMSFLKIGDVVAGSIASGGTTRRAAKMVCLDLDHPEVEDFIELKAKEERKARALAIGSQLLAKDDNGSAYDINAWEGEAISTVTGQNANNSLRVTNQFMDSLDNDKRSWPLKSRTTKETTKVVKVDELWEKICHAAWACGDPGLQFHDTTNSWHTCPNDGQINASNPCGEYLFLDNTACNLASLNLTSFLKPDGSFDISAFSHATRLWTIVLEISVFMASFPSAEIALGSYNYRTLGLGYANLGGLLMQSGLAYDSDEGRAYAAAITALMTALSYATSGDMATEIGPFPRYEANKEEMGTVLTKHAKAVKDIQCIGQAGSIVVASIRIWDSVLSSTHFRNAQTTLLAPTGTIRLVMDCDTSGIEPAYSLVEYKKLAGGGNMKIPNPGIFSALIRLGYTVSQATVVVDHVEQTGSLQDLHTRNGLPFIDAAHTSVFDCAGEISPLGHVKMVAAVQPFLSGGVSKTINMPHDATVSDVDLIYRESWKLGLKSVSVYRDGCKTNQPLSSTEVDQPESWTPKPTSSRGFREHLPARRSGWTQKFKVDDHSLYLRTGEYEDGRLGEIWVNLSREGSTVRSLMECFAKAISLGIQYGAPLEEYVEAFIYTKFEPAGIVEGSEDLRLCSSIVDLIFRTIGIEYLDRADLSSRSDPKLPRRPTEVTPTWEQVAVPVRFGLASSGGDPNICWECGNASLARTGSCVTCTVCSANTGCS